MIIKMCEPSLPHAAMYMNTTDEWLLTYEWMQWDFPKTFTPTDEAKLAFLMCAMPYPYSLAWGQILGALRRLGRVRLSVETT